MPANDSRTARRPYVLAAVLAVLGLIFGWFGGELVGLGGSPYYLAAGIGLFVTAILVWRKSPLAAWLYAAITLATILWALWETGGYPWAMMPRIMAPAALGLWFALPWVRRSLGHGALATAAGPVLLLASVGLIAGAAIKGQYVPIASAGRMSDKGTPAGSEWTHYGGDAAGTRYVASDQINRGNVTKLVEAWRYRTGDKPIPGQPDFANAPFQTVPLKIENSLYFCTPHNVVVALDADTGKEEWRYDPKVNGTGVPHFVCRGVSRHVAANETGLCADRLLMGTVDNRLLAIDRKTGKICPDFGKGGEVSLLPGLGEFPRGWYYVTSPPVILNNVAVIGSFILDSQTVDLPPGVVRGYDVKTGELLWAWDLVSPTSIKKPGPDVQYRKGTANYWSIGSADPELGLVYLPTGNTTPDFYGGHRTPEMEVYPSSIVALDAKTGDVRWNFQTVHHDIWDFDIGSQPVLTDFDTPNGKVPALIAPTKRGEVFILDRRTGKPLTEVTEKKVPQGPAKGEWLSPTQPYSTGFPSFAPKDLSEVQMWGATPLDQLWCRIRFKQSRYEGQFTPQSTQGSVIYAGSFGSIDWGSVSIDPERGLMLVNSSGLPYYQKLIPRAEADKLGVRPYGMSKPGDPPPSKKTYKMFAQEGTPYAIDSFGFLSPVGYPCNQPPWGKMTAVDLKTRKIVWERPLGTTKDAAPLGIALPVGVFNLGGSVTTRGGLVFVGATIDNYLRAFDTETGAELWKGRLPAGGQSNAMSYVSGKTGRQYVVIAAGGHGTMRTKTGDYVVAYALPK